MNKLLYLIRTLILFACVFLIPFTGIAVESNEVLNDPQLEQRAREISKNLRCLVCRNESIDDSSAELAKDLRLLVRERLVIGETNNEIINYIVSRYGEYVLLMPRFDWFNLLLWLCGPIMLILGVSIAVWSFKNKPEINENVLSDKEQQRIRELLKD